MSFPISDFRLLCCMCRPATLQCNVAIGVVSGDVAARYVLNPGDEIVSVDGKQFARLSLYEAWNYLKALPEGHVSLTIRRHNKPTTSTVPSPAAVPATFL